MATNLLLDDKLILLLDDKLTRLAVKLGKHKPKREAVNAALGEYIRLRPLDAWDDLAGRVEYYEASQAKPAKRRRTA